MNQPKSNPEDQTNIDNINDHNVDPLEAEAPEPRPEYDRSHISDNRPEPKSNLKNEIFGRRHKLNLKLRSYVNFVLGTPSIALCNYFSVTANFPRAEG